MVTKFEPPPTYADVTLIDSITGKPRFNPIWLKWFLDLTTALNNSGVAAGTTGTVTDVSVNTAHGFSGSVANPSTTAAITLSTSVHGIAKGDGTTLSAAIAGVDYLAPGVTLTPLSPATASVTSSSSQVVAANASRKGLVIVNEGTAAVYFGLGATAVNGSGITLSPGGVWVMDTYTFVTTSINAVSPTATSLSIQEYNT